uniref:transcription factor E2F7 n=1 Tax=Pristiophorus japonicus TaxID=55135 RepID=UPI00398F41BD
MECLKLKDLLTARYGKCDFPPETLNDESKSAQKENLFMEPKRASPQTPVKTELSAGSVSRRKCCTPDRIQITPNKQADKSSPEPWSPTANLKMLISAASPDIRDREKKKELFRQIENERVRTISNVIQLAAIDDGATDELEPQRPSRKQKSLGLLCQKFLARYPNDPISTEKTEISLDEVATELGVERRRIYDIVNVLESLQLVSRLAKNQYSWHGLRGLEETLAALKRRGEQQRYAKQLAWVRHKELELGGDGADRRHTTREAWSGWQEAKSAEAESKSASMNSRKDKSLRIMSEKFVMLFLVSEPKTVALDIAAKILIEESQQDSADNSKFKTKIRRLYDIANVLTSLGLIKKVHVTEDRGRKPAFKWVGTVHQTRPHGVPDHSVALSASTVSAEAVLPVAVSTEERRAASFHARHGSQGNQYKAQSALCSPTKFRHVRSAETEDSSSKMAQLVAACRLQFEKDLKNSECCPERAVCRPQSIPLASRPLFITSTAASEDSALRPQAQHGFALAQSEPTLPFCLPGGQLEVPPPPAANEAYPCFLENQPIVFLQGLPSAPVLMLYAEPSPGSGQAPPAGQEAALTSGAQEVETRAPGGNPRKRSPAKGCAVPHGPREAGRPDAKRGKTLCCLEPASAESVPSVLSVDKRTSTRHTDALRSHTTGLDRVSETTVYPPCQTMDVGPEAPCPATEIPAADCHTDPRDAEERNRFGTVENGPVSLSFTAQPLLKEANQEPPMVPRNLAPPPPFAPRGQNGSAENGRCFRLPAATGMGKLSLLLAANQSVGGVSLSPSQVASVSLPYQVMVPVLCQAIPTTTPAGNSIPNTGLLQFNLRDLSLLPTGQLLVSGVSIPAPAGSAVRPVSPERQIYSPVLAPSARENLPVKLDPPALPPVASLKLQQQSPMPMAPTDGQQQLVESCFHTPVPTAQGKKAEGLQVMVGSPAQRRLEIENSGAK